jgi:hypothetical protein
MSIMPETAVGKYEYKGKTYLWSANQIRVAFESRSLHAVRFSRLVGPNLKSVTCHSRDLGSRPNGRRFLTQFGPAAINLSNSGRLIPLKRRLIPIWTRSLGCPWRIVNFWRFLHFPILSPCSACVI